MGHAKGYKCPRWLWGWGWGFLPCVGDCAKQTNTVGASNGVASTQWHYRRHGLPKGLLYLLNHPTTGELLNPKQIIHKDRLMVSLHLRVCRIVLCIGRDLSYLGPPCSTMVTGPTRWVTPPTLTAAVSNSLMWTRACFRVLPRLHRVCAADKKLLLDTYKHDQTKMFNGQTII